MKIKCGKTNVSFKNYTASSKTIESLFEPQLKFKDNQNKVLGYDSVPPPFNHNYTSILMTQEEIVREAHLRYGKPAGFVSGGIQVENTNVSTSCGGKVAEDENKENTTEQTNDSLNSESVASNSVTLNKPDVEKYRLPIPVKKSA